MKYPFKFLDAYTREDHEVFFGREKEIGLLGEMIYQTDLLLIYGGSGVGKSSLLQCGLAGLFQSHDWLPIGIRRNGNLNESLKSALESAVGDAKQLQTLTQIDAWTPCDGTLVQTKPRSPLEKKLRAVYLRFFKPVYLIFDQFEELFILGSSAERQVFIQTLKELQQIDQPVKVIISIREEYLGHLYEFEREIPEIFHKKLRVERMNLEKVKSVIKGVGASPVSNVSLREGEEDRIAEAIYDKIKESGANHHTQLPFLQVLLDKLYLLVAKDPTRQTPAEFTLAHLEQLGNIADILRGFLDEQVLFAAKALCQKPDVVWKMLSPFVTLEGTKEPIKECELIDRLPGYPPGLLSKALQVLVSRRLLRFIEATDTFELVHDSLANEVHERRPEHEVAALEVRRLVKAQVALHSNSREFFSEKQLLLIEPFLDSIAFSMPELRWIRQSRNHHANEKRKREIRKNEALRKARRQFRVVRGMLCIAIVGLVATGYFSWRANTQKRLAEEANYQANQNLLDAYSWKSNWLQEKIDRTSTWFQTISFQGGMPSTLDSLNGEIKTMRREQAMIQQQIQELQQ